MSKLLQIINHKGNVQVIFEDTVMSFSNCIFDPIKSTETGKTYRIISMETKLPVCIFTTKLNTTEAIIK